MFTLQEYEHRNSEGYCKKCRQPLGISGVCAACELERLKPPPSWLGSHYFEVEAFIGGKWRYIDSVESPFIDTALAELRRFRKQWRIRRLSDGIVIAQSREA